MKWYCIWEEYYDSFHKPHNQFWPVKRLRARTMRVAKQRFLQHCRKCRNSIRAGRIQYLFKGMRPHYPNPKPLAECKYA